MFAVYSENHMKPIDLNSVWSKRELSDVKEGGTYSYHCNLEG
jgi:hypothetical protein